MVSGNSRTVESDQHGVHQNLEKLVSRHLDNSSQKPFNEHTLAAFAYAEDWLRNWQGPLILDSCCGVGESTAIIAKQHPDARVLGVDKSALRTNKHQHYSTSADNYLVLRADLNDFWRLALNAAWKLHKHYLLYPNPYPKASQLQRRWHASAAFPSIVALGGQLEVRSNWKIYIQEFAEALKISKFNCAVEAYQAPTAMTPFERKYWHSGQASWRLVADLIK
jgi:tRNA G46 methylase TrmB